MTIKTTINILLKKHGLLNVSTLFILFSLTTSFGSFFLAPQIVMSAPRCGPGALFTCAEIHPNYPLEIPFCPSPTSTGVIRVDIVCVGGTCQENRNYTYGLWTPCGDDAQGRQMICQNGTCVSPPPGQPPPGTPQPPPGDYIPDPTPISLDANPERIARGGTSELRWTIPERFRGGECTARCLQGGCGDWSGSIPLPATGSMSGSRMVSPSTRTAEFFMRCTERGDSGRESSDRVIVRVFDFTISNSGEVRFAQGSSGWNTITLGAITPFPAPEVTLRLVGLPTGLGHEFSDYHGTPVFLTGLTITDPQPPHTPGRFPVTVRATSVDPPIIRETTFDVVVASPPRLTVNKTNSTGTGTIRGTVGSPPTTVIDCGPTCPEASRTFAHGTTVTLTATPGTGVFAGWSGGGCSGTNTTCTVTMNADLTVTARFLLPRLTVVRHGSGTVTSDIGGIHCGAVCSRTFNRNDSVTLTATPADGHFFERWTNCPHVLDATRCQVVMSHNRTVNAHFISLISSITAPEWVRKNSPFNITVNTARTSNCTLTSTANDNRSAGPGTSFTFDNFRQSQPVIYTISCRYGNTVDTRTVRINVLPTFGEF